MYFFSCFIKLFKSFAVLKLTQQQLHSNTVASSTANGVSGVYTDETETISVMEGDSVTLHTGVTEIQRDEQILWTFRHQKSETRIAEIYKQIISIYDSVDNERFRGRLQIDEKTGSLNITNINTLHSGLYKLQVISEKVKHMSFNIAVYALLTVPVISDSLQKPSVSEKSSSQNCSLVCSAENVSDVTLSWYKGISVLSNISVSDLSISLSLPLEIQCLDDSYSCVVSYSFTNRTTHLNITDLCQACPEARQHVFITLIMVGLVVVIIAGVVLMYCCCKNNKQAKRKAQTTEEEVVYTDTTFTTQRALDAETNRRDETEYSRVVLR
ncbi:SLAM family member 9 isoform X1 [Pimephales promelas]|uniref:SLAM family member 9 isoform X1 n=1 Tax=Pimephales promelas TaxID=90988 RepID=UPI001955F3BF|nr:SLAM family member 9 isoform X1 [Pimephales promelas]